MADHSNQIGAEKVLAVLAVRATTNLDSGEALQHKSVRVLEVNPGTQWKTANMQREFQGIADRLIEFVADSEQHVRDGERIPMSTEILESAFGLYKQLEGQQSKSGFTSLLACFPAMLSPTSPAEITAAFDGTSRADVSRWIQDRFPSTLTARRQAAYAEFKATTNRAILTPTTASEFDLARAALAG